MMHFIGFIQHSEVIWANAAQVIGFIQYTGRLKSTGRGFFAKMLKHLIPPSQTSSLH
jgi:hypothetical protein